MNEKWGKMHKLKGGKYIYIYTVKWKNDSILHVYKIQNLCVTNRLRVKIDLLSLIFNEHNWNREFRGGKLMLELFVGFSFYNNLGVW